MPYANNKDADQPAHPHSLISVFVVRCIDSTTPKNLRSDCLDVQADPSLCWAHINGTDKEGIW